MLPPETLTNAGHEVYRVMGDEALILCPTHDDHNPSCWVNLSKLVWYCFACHAKGTVAQLVGDITEEDVEVALLKAAIADLEASHSEHTEPETLLSRFVPTPYWKARGITPQIEAQFQLSYDPLSDSAVVPLRNRHGELLGVMRRYLGIDPTRDRFHYPGTLVKKNLLMLAHAIDAPQVVVTEGVIDALKVWSAGFQAVALGGSSMSREQARILAGLGCSVVHVMMDADSAGDEAADQVCELLEPEPVWVIRHQLPRGEDPGSLTLNHIGRLVRRGLRAQGRVE